MKTKESVETKTPALEKLNTKSKPRSLRPMRSMVAVRSFKPKTGVATLAVKDDEQQERN